MNDTKDNKRLKLIEILLIVGGIIGGFGFQNENPLIKKVIFPVFLISSLMYYLQVSNKEHVRGRTIFTGYFNFVLWINYLSYAIRGYNFLMGAAK